MTLSVQLYSLRDQLLDDRAGTLQQLAEIGFDEFEPFGLGESGIALEERLSDARALSKVCASLGVSTSITHAAVPADLDELIAELHALGARTIIVPNPKKVSGFDAQIFESPSRIAQFADRMNTVAEKLASHGIALGYHNHEFEWSGASGREGMAALWDLLSPAIRAEVDIYWATVAGINVPDYLRSISDRVIALHVKDGPAQRGLGQTPLGTGDVDVKACLAAAPEAATVLEIDVTDLDRLTLLKDNARWLKAAV